MSESYRISIIDSVSGMAEMAKPWNGLLVESRSNTIFLTWEWLYTWAECYIRSDRRLFIILVHKDHELIGIAPWCICHVRGYGLSLKQVEFLGIPETGSDYLDVFTKRGKEKEVAYQIYHFLKTSTSLWDSVALRDMASDSLFLLHLKNRMEEDGKYTELQYGSYCPSVSLPRTVDAFKSGLSSNRRQQFSRHLRLLAREGDVVHRVQLAQDAGRALNELRPLYEQRWGDADGLFRFLEKFISRTEATNVVQFDFLQVAGRNIAGLLHLRYGDTLSMYVMGIDHSFDKSISVGNILVGLSIEKAIADGFSNYDFLRGQEDYKFHWSNDGKSAVHLTWYGQKPAPLLRMVGECAKSIVKVLVR